MFKLKIDKNVWCKIRVGFFVEKCKKVSLKFNLFGYKNNIYGFPWILGTRVIFGNKDLLKQTDLGENHISTIDWFPRSFPELTSLLLDHNQLSESCVSSDTTV